MSHFNFSKKEFNGLLVFCFLLIIVIASPFIYSWLKPKEVFDFSDYEKDILAFEASMKDKPTYQYKNSKYSYYNADKKRKPEYFEFNPNNLDVSEWQRLGLSDRQIKIIKNYEAKGGRFFKKEDVKKIYGISEEQYQSLAPYIRIPEREFKEAHRDYNTNKAFTIKATLVDLNTADSATLTTIKGIGPAFASRIIRYRNRLGGFYSKTQLREVYGIDSAKFESLKDQVTANGSGIQKIAINSALFDDLKKMPYLSYKQISAILNYKKQHGNYASLSDLKKVLILSDETLIKLAPYVSFN